MRNFTGAKLQRHKGRYILESILETKAFSKIKCYILYFAVWLFAKIKGYIELTLL